MYSDTIHKKIKDTKITLAATTVSADRIRLFVWLVGWLASWLVDPCQKFVERITYTASDRLQWKLGYT